MLNRRGQTMITAACEKMDISYTEYVLLIQLYEAEGRSQDELASLLVLDKAIITRTVTALEKKGLIRREKDLRDKRVKHLYLTDAAKEKQKDLTAIIDTWIGYLFETMDEKDQEILFKGTIEATERAANITVRGFTSMLKKEK